MSGATAGPSNARSRWIELLNDAARTNGVPAATLAVWDGERLFEAAAGTRVPGGTEPCQPGDVFRTGSIAKLLTTVGLMRWADRGAIRLEDRVIDHLPELRTSNPSLAAEVTVSQLLSHTSGLDGDFFEDTGSGEDCLARYVDECRAVDFLFEPGRGFSYCNAAFPIAARMAERLSSVPWDRTLLDDVIEPLGLSSTVTLPPASPSWRPMLSYVPDADGGEWVPVRAHPPRSLAACGATPYTCASDLVRLGFLFVSSGRSLAGRQVLGEETVEQMAREWCAGPGETFAHGWGLGTMRFGFTGGRTVLGHDGAAEAFHNMLRADPASGTVVALMTNGGDARSLYVDVASEIFGELAGSVPAPPPQPAPAPARPLAAYAGVYATRSAEITVEFRDDRLIARCRPTRFGVGLVPVLDVVLTPVDEERFLAASPFSRIPLVHRFLDLDDTGSPRSFHFRGRAHPRSR